ncbi:MAG: Gldg family protein [Thermodesulfobacteriota bacterium]
MTRTLSITRKELRAYFGSPMATIFIGAFLLAALFSFFWLETFFARNTADIRPLFRWMPLLMIFLVAALTMRQWSEEQRMGTLEVLFTLPVKLSRLVLGKFLAVLLLVAVALALTMGLPVTVSLLGNLDWGPVLGGYLGALLMAAAYIAIGLFVSSRTDNQIIALILTVLLCGFFYLLGSDGITTFMGTGSGELFRLLGTGSRFASIERGVLDLRDLVYYLSLTGLFLALNTLALDRKRWSGGALTAGYRRNAVLAVVLIAANLLALNVWLNSFGKVRLDFTEAREYSISDTTRNLLAGLTEPLILRGYFSEKTHPLLAPLVPRIKDMMKEYAIAAGRRVEVAFVDPKFDEELETEANQQYGIKPVPFQIAGRYEASVVNSYFNILIKYGDQYVTLGFDDLIEIERRKDGQLDVRLRNLEYDLTKSIKKVVYGFQSIASIFDNSKKDLSLVFLVTPAKLPADLKEAPATIREVAAELGKETGGRLRMTEIDPDSGQLDPQQIKEQYNIDPLAVSFFDPQTFYLHLLVRDGDSYERVYLGDMSKAEIRKDIEGVLKRSSSGFLKTVGFWTPPEEAPPQMNPFQQQPPREQYTLFQQVLRENYNLEKVDLASGRVPGHIDVLLLVAPRDMTDTDRLAVDQYLMQGGSVVALTGSHVLDLSPYAQTLNVRKVENGIDALLSSYGLNVGGSMVMDMQNEPFPIPVERNLGGITVREIRSMDYPYFVDIRQDGMDKESAIVANLPAVTLHWASPLTVDAEKNKDRKVTTLLRSSDQSWLSEDESIQPNFTLYPDRGFKPGDQMGSQVLAVTLQGAFASAFNEANDPRRTARPEENTPAAGAESPPPQPSQPAEPLIPSSPESARLVVVGSSEFVNDTVIGISRSLGQDRFMNGLEFLHNTIDWSVEDQELLSIRSRGSHARLLLPLTREQQRFWEWLNYSIALFALILVSVAGALRQKRERPMQLV